MCYIWLMYYFHSQFFLGIFQSSHTTLFDPNNPDMKEFSRIRGNVNANCPDIVAPVIGTLFEQVNILKYISNTRQSFAIC